MGAFNASQSTLVRLLQRREGADDDEDAEGVDDVVVTQEMLDQLALDPRTKTVFVRAGICQKLGSTTIVKTREDVTEMQESLFETISRDAYLSEVITSKEVCATLGRIRYVREVMLALQPDYDSVLTLNDAHKDMIQTVSTSARALLVEVQQSLAIVAAEDKALKDEKKAAIKEEKRLKKKC